MLCSEQTSSIYPLNTSWHYSFPLKILLQMYCLAVFKTQGNFEFCSSSKLYLFFLNKKNLNKKNLNKIHNYLIVSKLRVVFFLNLFREYADITPACRNTPQRRVPTSRGVFLQAEAFLKTDTIRIPTTYVGRYFFVF